MTPERQIICDQLQAIVDLAVANNEKYIASILSTVQGAIYMDSVNDLANLTYRFTLAAIEKVNKELASRHT